MKNDFLMSADVARLAKVTPATVRFWETTGRLRAIKTPTGRRLFERDDVEAYIANRAKASLQEAR